MDEVKVTLITRNFGNMLEELASIDPRVEFRDVVREVAIRVIAGALRRTRIADPKKITAAHEKQEWTTLDGKKYKLSWHEPDALYNRITRRRAERLAVTLGAVGLARRSWLDQAQELGGNIPVTGAVRRANYRGHNYPENVSSLESTTGGAYSLKIINSSPIVQAAGGERALLSAMAGETRYFYTLLAKGAFRTLASRAARYPGIFVQPATLA